MVARKQGVSRSSAKAPKKAARQRSTPIRAARPVNNHAPSTASRDEQRREVVRMMRSVDPCGVRMYGHPFQCTLDAGHAGKHVDEQNAVTFDGKGAVSYSPLQEVAR